MSCWEPPGVSLKWIFLLSPFIPAKEYASILRELQNKAQASRFRKEHLNAVYGSVGVSADKIWKVG
jgi:hypothetical protein